MIVDYYNDNWVIVSQLERGVKTFLEENFASLPENYVMLPRYSSLGKSSCYIRNYFDLGEYILLPRKQLESLLSLTRFPITIGSILSRYYETRFKQLATYVLDTLGLDYPKKKSNLRLTIEWTESKGYSLEEFRTNCFEQDQVKRMYQSQALASGPNPCPELVDIDMAKFKKLLVDNKDLIKRCLPGIELREFQVNAVIESLTHNIREDLPYPGGIIKAPARSGKTEIICALAKLINQPTLVLTDRKQLIRQIRQRMLARELDEKIGYVDGSSNQVENITVSTIQSISKNPELYYDPYLVIVDEVHTISNERFVADFDKIGLSRDIESNQGFLMKSTSPITFGTSATPFGFNQANNLCVVSGMASVCYEISRHRLEELGIVAKSNVYLFELDHRLCKKGYKVENTNTQELYLYNYAYNQSRNKLADFAMKLAGEGRHLILVNNKKHIDELLKTYPDALFCFGSETESYKDETTGKRKTKTIASMKVKERERIIEEFLSKDSGILIATSVVFTGIDFPGGMDSVINLAAGSSFESIIQRICRGLNPNKENKIVHLYDVLDGGHGHAKLRKAADLRHKAYELEGFNVNTVKVPKQFY